MNRFQSLLDLPSGNRLTRADREDRGRIYARLLRERPKEFGWIYVDGELGGGVFFVAKEESRFANQHRTTDWRNDERAKSMLRRFLDEVREARLQNRR